MSSPSSFLSQAYLLLWDALLRRLSITLDSRHLLHLWFPASPKSSHFYVSWPHLPSKAVVSSRAGSWEHGSVERSCAWESDSRSKRSWVCHLISLGLSILFCGSGIKCILPAGLLVKTASTKHWRKCLAHWRCSRSVGWHVACVVTPQLCLFPILCLSFHLCLFLFWFSALHLNWDTCTKFGEWPWTVFVSGEGRCYAPAFSLQSQ